MGLVASLHFRIAAIRKYELAAIGAMYETVAFPVWHQMGLHLTDESGVSLAPDEFDSLGHEMSGDLARAPPFAHAHALDLGEAIEPAQPQAAHRLLANLGQKMRGAGEVVSVELLFVRAILLADVNQRTRHRDALHVIGRARNPHGHRRFERLKSAAIHDQTASTESSPQCAPG